MADDIVHWREDGTPFSPRFGDIYRSTSGLAQTREVFLRGCGLLPEAEQAAAWTGAPHWAVLETGFGLGLNFLATWQAWRDDAQRPARLLYSAVEAFVPTAADLLRSVAAYPALQPLAQALAAQWHGLLPGVHRLSFEGDRVQLTLAVGDVRAALGELRGAHDSVFLDGFNPALNPDMWSLPVLRAVTRLARRGARAATWCVAAEVRARLAQCGFDVQRVPGPPPKQHVLRATLAPRWTVRARHRSDAPVRVAAPARCAVVGAGLAGASVAYSLARRGWQVTVLDQAEAPAAGASGLPAGVVAPHVSPDDRPLSRLSRAGVRATLARAQALLQPGVDFAVSGVLERHAPGERRLPADWPSADTGAANAADTSPASAAITQAQARAAGVPLDDAHLALWHARAGWVRPAALVRAMLATPGVRWQGGSAVAGLRAAGAVWQVLGVAGDALAEAELVFLAAGFGTLALVRAAEPTASLPLHALRGQVAWGPIPHDAALPPFPVNGHGSLIGHVPGDDGPLWVSGATFEREQPAPLLRADDHAANYQRLAELLPGAAAALDAQWDDGRAKAWAGVRATLPDRLPALGAFGARNTPDSLNSMPNWHAALEGKAPAAMNSGVKEGPLPLHLLTGLGARGLTLTVLCGEIAAAWLHDEPLPVAASLAHKLRAQRFESG